MSTQQQPLSTSDVAQRLVELCREGKILEAGEELHSDDVISEEPNSTYWKLVEGKQAVKKRATSSQP